MKPVKIHTSSVAVALSMVSMMLVALGGCGRSSAGPAPFAGVTPSAVRITSYVVTSDSPSSVTIDLADVAAELFHAATALPQAPKQQICDAIAGPRYDMVFLDGETTVIVARADRGGCPSVTLGADDVRQADQAFFHLLERDIADATPPVQPDRLMAVSFLQAARPAMAAAIPSSEKAQQLYDAIRALPSLPENTQCTMVRVPRYELVFFVGEKLIHATAQRNGCSTVQLVPGSPHQANDAFWQLLADALANAASEQAHPYELDLKTEPAPGDPSTTAKAVTIQHDAIVQRLYDATYALPPLPPDRTCIATVGTRYGLSFSAPEQIELLSVIADKGGCGTVSFGDGDVRLASQSYWDLVHLAERG